MKIWIRFSPLLLLLVTQSGCTYALWTNDNLEAWREPAQDPHLHLYAANQGGDVLVVYKEISERNDAVRTREYWLNKNQKRLEQQHAPVFASKKSARLLSPVPVYDSMPEADLQRGLYAVGETNQPTFTLYAGTHETGSYQLPVYNDHIGVIEKTALTPFALTADAGIVAGYGCYFLARGMAESGDTYTLPVRK